MCIYKCRVCRCVSFCEPSNGYRRDEAVPTVYRACRMYLLLRYLYRPALFLELSHQRGHISCCVFTESDFAIEKYLQILHRKLLNLFTLLWSHYVPPGLTLRDTASSAPTLVFDMILVTSIYLHTRHNQICCYNRNADCCL
jgi:hypothetical protein